MQLVNLVYRSSILLVVALLLSGCYKYISPEASKEFNARADPFSVSVYPVNVIRPPGTIQPNIRLAEKVVTFLQGKKGTDLLSPGMTDSGRTSPYAATPGDDPVLAVNGRLPPDSRPRY